MGDDGADPFGSDAGQGFGNPDAGFDSDEPSRPSNVSSRKKERVDRKPAVKEEAPKQDSDDSELGEADSNDGASGARGTGRQRSGRGSGNSQSTTSRSSTSLSLDGDD